jgi:N-sulfoglucosamine sulfohydrolase
MKKSIMTGLFSMACVSMCLAKAQPNIVMMFADDLGRYASAYSDPNSPSPNDIVKTPVFDRIAREGARFDNAFISAPSCTPSRGALSTGRHFFRNGSHSQLHHPWVGPEADPISKIKGVAEQLRDSGYHIGHTYKVHIDERLIGGKECIYDGAGRAVNDFSENVSRAQDKEAEKKKIFEQVRDNFKAFLAKRKPGQPFYYSFHPTNTHRSWEKGSGKALWNLEPEALKGKLDPCLPDVPEIREDFADYLGEAMAFDAACGVIIEELEKMGELDNTVVAISGDHGAPGFPRGKCNTCDFGARVLLGIRWPTTIEAGKVIKSPVSLVDMTPTFLSAAGVPALPDMDGESLLPVMAKGGSEENLRGWVLIGREVHAQPAREGNLPYPVRSLRTRDFLYTINFKPDRWPAGDPNPMQEGRIPTPADWQKNTYTGYADMDASPTKAWFVGNSNNPNVIEAWKLAIEKRPGEELYDLKKDPYQLRNLAEDPAYKEQKQALNKQLMAILTNGHDPRLDNDAFDRPPYRKEAKGQKGTKKEKK